MTTRNEPTQRRDIAVLADRSLEGVLELPPDARALTVFAHGHGSDRKSSRNRLVAECLRRAGVGTLLVNLTAAEERSLPLSAVAARLVKVAQWLARDPLTRDMPLSYIGGSTGAAVALMAAAEYPERVASLVCRGGRPDLAPAGTLSRVEAPTLFLVGSLDGDVLAMNRRAAARLRCENRVEVIHGASHLFEEPGALELVGDRAASWIVEHSAPELLRSRFVHGAADSDVRQREDGLGTYEHRDNADGFRDRVEAGRALARELERFRGENPIVLGIPRGGVPVAYEVAEQLGAALDVVVGRKIGAPGQEELAIGAVTADGTCYLNRALIDRIDVGEDYLARATQEQCAEARRRERIFRKGLPGLDIRGRTILLVDDGLATGATMRAIIRSLRYEHARKIVVAVPVGAREACEEIGRDVDEVVCLRSPSPFIAVGVHYRNFDQTSDDEVARLLARRR
jgi:predicted phosphoribosyltransferase/dienelactone hydrolase